MIKRSVLTYTGLFLAALLLFITAGRCANAEDEAVLELPASLIRIEEEAFSRSTGIRKVIIKEGTLSIGSRAFADCDLEEVVLPKSLTYIADDAFDGNIRMKATADINTYAYDWAADRWLLEEASITDFAFQDLSDSTCKILSYLGHSNSVILPSQNAEGKTVVEIGEYAFYENTELSSIIIPPTVTEIGNEAFSSCTNLNSVRLGEGLTRLGYRVFFGSAVRELALPSTLKEINDYAFMGLEGLKLTAPEGTYAYYWGLAHYYIQDDYISSPVEDFKYQHYSSDHTYCGVTGYTGNDTEIAIPRFLGGIAVEEIRKGAFENCTDLISVTIPPEVTNIGENAFRECSSLTEVHLYNNVKTIGDKAFYNCENLSDINIPEKVETIGNGAFMNCNLGEVILPATLTSISYNAFYGNDRITIHAEPGTYAYDWALENFYIQEPAASPLEDFSFELVSDTEYAITGYSGDDKHIVIPAMVNGIKVIRIGSMAFKDNENIESIVIPATITGIGENAFTNCQNLAEVTIPATLQSISNYAFQNCVSLKAAELPEGLLYIAKSAFDGCTSLTEVNIPETNMYFISDEGVLYNKEKTEISLFPKGRTQSYIVPETLTSIPLSTFSGCAGLSSVIFPDSANVITGKISDCNAILYANLGTEAARLISWGDNAFRIPGTNYDLMYTFKKYEISGLEICSLDTDVSTFEIPENVTAIKDEAFAGHPNLIDIIIPDNVTSIGNRTFADCMKLKRVTVSGNMELTDQFEGCSDITLIIAEGATEVRESFIRSNAIISVLLPEGITSIGKFAFYYCEGLESVRLPESLNYIGESAFYNCIRLENIQFPEGLSEIGENAFRNCSSLDGITVYENTAIIGKYAFDCCTGLRYVDILSTAAEIGEYAFSGCTNLLRISIAGGSIGKNAFSSCSRLTDINLSERVANIGDFAFAGCENLKRITIPNGITNVGLHAFDGNTMEIYADVGSDGAKAVSRANYCFKIAGEPFELIYIAGQDSVDDLLLNLCNVDKDVTYFTIPDYVDVIGVNAFDGCSLLTDVNISNSVRLICSNAFSDCNSLRDITIPSSVWTIKSNAFKNCMNLTEIIIQGDTNIINAFINTPNLTDVTFAEGVTYIGGSAFEKTGIVHVSFPSTLKIIGVEAFRECSKLTGITFPENLETIEESAFYMCPRITTINYPEKLTSIGIAAFYHCERLVYETIPTGIEVGAQAFEGCRLASSSSGGEEPPDDSHVHNYEYYCDSDLVIHKYCTICEPRSEEQAAEDLINLQRYILKQRAGMQAISLEDPASLLLQTIAAENDEPGKQVAAYAFKLATFNIFDVVKKIIPGSTAVNEIRRNAIGQAIGRVLESRNPSYEACKDSDIYDALLIASLSETIPMVEELTNIYNDAGDCVEAIAEELGGKELSGADLWDYIRTSKPEIIANLNDKDGMKNRFKESFLDDKTRDLLFLIIDTGMDLNDYLSWTQEQTDLFSAYVNDAADVITFINDVKCAYADDTIIEEYCDAALAQLKSEFSWTNLKNCSHIVLENAAEAATEFAVDAGIAALIGATPGGVLTLVGSIGGFIAEVVAGTDTNVNNYEDIKILYKQIEQSVLNYATNIENGNFTAEVKKVHQINILLQKIAGLELAGAIDKGRMKPSTDSIVISYTNSVESLLN